MVGCPLIDSTYEFSHVNVRIIVWRIYDCSCADRLTRSRIASEPARGLSVAPARPVRVVVHALDRKVVGRDDNLTLIWIRNRLRELVSER